MRLLETFGLDGAIAEAEAGMVRRYTATLMHTIAGGAPGNGLAAATGGNAEALAKIVGDGNPVMPTFELAALEKILPDRRGVGRGADGAVRGQARPRRGARHRRAGVRDRGAPARDRRSWCRPASACARPCCSSSPRPRARSSAKAEGAHDKALLTAARAFANRVDHDTTHGEHVRHCSRAQLFHQLRDVHGVPDDRGVLLEVAALLHDVGEVVNVRGHHKHSEYMIRWARIPGLDDAGREMVALMARCHRKDAARIKQMVADAPLTKEQRVHLRRMIALLRVADGLDSEHRSRVEQVVCTRMGTAVVLDLVVRDGPQRDDAALLRKADLWKEELGLDLRVTVARPVVSPTEAAVTAVRAKAR